MKHFKKPTLKASAFAIRTSQRTDQKLQKSLLCQRRQKIVFKKISQRFKKNKNTPIHSPTNTADNDTELNINKAYSDTTDRRPAGNRVGGSARD